MVEGKPSNYIVESSHSKFEETFKKKQADNLSIICHQPNEPTVIGIVGMGFAGTTTAIRVLQLASSQVKLVLFEQEPHQIYGGLAYGSNSLMREHYLNIHAGRISIYRERPDDFLKWANEDADKLEWMEILRIPENEKYIWEERLTFTEFSAVPRLVYRLYLRDRFNHAVELAKEKKTVTVNRFDFKVYDLDELHDFTRLHYTVNGKSQGSIDVNIAVLCTGQLAPLLPRFTEEVKGHHSFFPQPYDPAFIESISDSTETDSILIVGSGLSAYDAAISAVEVGFKGKITMCSRNGFKHSPYPQNHSHKIFPQVFHDGFKSIKTADKMIAALHLAIENAREEFFPKHYPEEHDRVIPERVLKAIEPQVARFVRLATREEVRKFLIHRSWMTTMRTSVVPAVTQRVEESGVSSIMNSILTILEKNNKILSVKFENNSSQIISEQNYTQIVCCLGFNPEYSDSIGLWGEIMKKIAVPHYKTGLGIEVGCNGSVLRKRDDVCSRSLYAVGTMRQGDEIERRGRLGAFTFSIGTIRNQCLMTTLDILNNVESQEYRYLSDAERKRNERKINSLLGDTGEIRRKYNRLVSEIADAHFLANTRQRDDWVERLQNKIYELVPFDKMSEKDVRMLQHELWNKARLQAGHQVTDIRRLSERYAIVRSYRPGIQSQCVAEKKECKDLLKLIMSQLSAESISLSLYLEEARCLYPFVDFMRLNRFTPTPYGAHNAGRLVKAYIERVDKEQLFSSKDFFPDQEIIPYYSKARLRGMIITDYNATTARKEIYETISRQYPHLLVALVLDKEKVVGVIYLEAPTQRKFEESDVVEMFALMGGLPALLSKSIKTWEPHADLDMQDQNLTDMVVERKANMCHVNFTNSKLNEVSFDEVDLSFAIFNGAECKKAEFEKAEMRVVQMIGTKFIQACLRETNLSGSVIIGADFTEADLRNCVIDGAIIERTRFRFANISNAALAGTRFINVDFSDVLLRKTRLFGVTFELCQWDRADLTGCIIDQMTYQNLPDEIVSTYKNTFTFID
ncbi:MAG: FAD/NAD(P)-binding protein [Methylococcaceae bacterium]